MSFLWPSLLWSLLLIPALVGLYLWAQTRRKRYALTFPTLGVVRQAVGQGPGFRRHIPAIVLLVALTALLFSLARPVAKVPILASGGLAVLVLDASGSMRAQDIAPSRIAAAQAAARAFIAKQPADAVIALVAFSATAYVLHPPTTDKELLLAAVDKMSLQRGTAIGSGLVVALNTILEYRGEPPLALSSGSESDPDAPPGWPSSEPPPLPEVAGEPLEGSVVVLLSDGQNNVGPDPLDVVPLAAQRQLRVFTVGLGDPNGVVLRAEGRRARVVLDEPTLQAIADKTKADYFRAGSETDLKKIYESLGTSLVVKTEKTELTALLAALAAVLVMASAGLSLFWFHRLP